jgi:hypothetical protein
VVLRLIERTVNLGIYKTYSDLKAAFLEKGCKIISEKPPLQILLKQGSLWGISPRTAKKTITVNFASAESETNVTCFSHMSSDWKNLTVIGCVFGAVLVGLCLWIIFDLDTLLVTQKPSFWSWLVTINGSVDLQIVHAFMNLTNALATFLSVVIVLEIGILIYVHSRIDRFANELLEAFSPVNEKQNGMHLNRL